MIKHTSCHVIKMNVWPCVPKISQLSGQRIMGIGFSEDLPVLETKVFIVTELDAVLVIQ
jgi:hypothetical protein